MKSVTKFVLGAEVQQNSSMHVEKGKSRADTRRQFAIEREGFSRQHNIASIGVNFRSNQTWTSTQGRASESE